MMRTLLISLLFSLAAVHLAFKTSPMVRVHSSGRDTAGRFLFPPFGKIVIDSNIQQNAHKPKVLARFSSDTYPDVGSLDNRGFKLYRYSEHWKPYTIFNPGSPAEFEDACVADINHDGWNDIILGGWGNKTIWAENPAGRNKDPYTTKWIVHVVDDSRFSHEVCVGDLNNDGKIDIITTSGVYIQKTPTEWTFIDIGRSGQGTFVADMLNRDDGYGDVIALLKKGKRNMIAWFENPGHLGGDPATDPWIPRVIDANPGGDKDNFEMTTMAFTAGDVNGDHRVDLVCASQGEGPGKGNDPHQVGDGLVWYEAPKDPRCGKWIKHVVGPSIGWVHASSIKLADFNGDGWLDINYAEQDQSKDRADGSSGTQQLGIFYNLDGKGTRWDLQVLSQYPAYGAGGFNSKVGVIGTDSLPSIFTSLHGYFKDANPLILWRHQ